MASPSPMPSAPPVLRRIALLLGWLALIATLALLSPGVVATANAEEPTASAGPSCPISRAADERSAVELAQAIERLRSEVAEKKSGGEDVVSLNTRGFNYPTTRNPLEDDHR